MAEGLLNTKGIEYVFCNLCGADRTKIIYHVPVRPDQLGIYGQDVWPIVQCQQCGLVYTNPRLDTLALQEYYKFNNEFDYQFIQDWFIGSAALQKPTWQRFLRTIQRFVPSGKLLDIGCGPGSFLVEAQQVGYQVEGQEVASYFVEYCRSNHGLLIHQGEVGDIPVPPHSFDCITAFDVIEHHPNPRKMLQEIHRLIRPGGLVVVGTHDLGNPFAQWYGRFWRHINPIGHLTYFTRRTLTAMLKNSGFEVVQTGGLHTIDNKKTAELYNWITQFIKVILLRTLVIKLYKPVAQRFPVFTKWEISFRRTTLNHKKLMVRAGNQVMIDDNMVILAKAIKL